MKRVKTNPMDAPISTKDRSVTFAESVPGNKEPDVADGEIPWADDAARAAADMVADQAVALLRATQGHGRRRD